MKKINIVLIVVALLFTVLAVMIATNSDKKANDDASVTGFGINADRTVFAKVYERFGSKNCVDIINSTDENYIFGENSGMSIVSGKINSMGDNSPLNCEYKYTNDLTVKLSINTYGQDDVLPEAIDTHLESLANANFSRSITQSIVGITDYIYGEAKVSGECGLIIFHPLNDLKSVNLTFSSPNGLSCEELEATANKFTEVISTKIVEELDSIYKLYLSSSTADLLSVYQMEDYAPLLSYYTGL